MTKQCVTSVLFFFTFSCCSPARAEWTELGYNNLGTIFYLDFSEIKLRGNYVYYWLLSDFIDPSPHGDFSAKILYELDCGTPIKQRASQATYYTASMAEGVSSALDNSGKDWEYTIAGSVGDTITKIVCSHIF
ncbi:MAG: hypothetical protein HOL33_02830 [Tateyamaria sp.]|nr:hypothetical protein [Tateyamaria sp.]